MTAAIGFPTLRLIRHAIGGFSVPNTTLGSTHEIDPKTLLVLFA